VTLHVSLLLFRMIFRFAGELWRNLARIWGKGSREEYRATPKGNHRIQASIRKMKVAELKEELRKLGLSVSGRKADLQARLAAASEDSQDAEMHAAGSITQKRSRLNGPVRSSFGKKKMKPSSKMRDESLREVFSKYKEAEGDCITAEGVLKFCEDLGVDPEDPIMLSLSYFMEASNLGVFTEKEFVRGLCKLEVGTIEELKSDNVLKLLRNTMTPESKEFRNVYKFAYDWACEPNQKSMGKEVALGLWPLFLKPLGFDLCDNFIAFLNNSSAKGVTKDLWIQTLQFIDVYQRAGNSLANHDSENGAWPVLIDEFVDTVKSKSETQMETS